MFSALKRLTGKTENGIVPGVNPGHHAMSQNLQRKFAKGVQYNMKIIIKGDRNTGKSCLFYRLQGKKFVEEYVPTDEIQVASIQWNYKASDDVVKVEVWDVVDKGKKRIPLDGLKLGPAPEQAPALDAEFLDVYKGTNGLILMMDITKSWTFDYIQRELAKVPEHIPVLILGNHCDMSHHRTITMDHVLYYIESIQRPKDLAQIRYTESSMSNGFGLKYIHKFFCLPFLQLQHITLVGLLDRNKVETDITVHELDLYQQSEDADYDRFLQLLTNKRRQLAESNAASAMNMSQSQNSNLQQSHSQTQLSTHSQYQPGVGVASTSSGGGINTPSADLNAIKARSQSSPDVTSMAHPSTPRPTTNPLPLSPSGQPIIDPAVAAAAVAAANAAGNSNTSNSSIMAKIFGKKDNIDDKTQGGNAIGVTVLDGVLDLSVRSVEEFVPDEGSELDNSFLEDSSSQQLSSNAVNALRHAEQADSDSDIETGNPLVSEFQDEIDPEDFASCVQNINLSQQHSSSPSPSLPQSHSKHIKSNIQSDHRQEQPNEDGSDDIGSGDYANNEKDVNPIDGSYNVTITEDVLEEWMGRVSPEGGEDSGPGGAESSDSTAKLHNKKHQSRVKDKSEEKNSKSKHHKKKSNRDKSSKDKESNKDKEEKKNKKKKSSSNRNCRNVNDEEGRHDELEEFLNSRDNSYEII